MHSSHHLEEQTIKIHIKFTYKVLLKIKIVSEKFFLYKMRKFTRKDEFIGQKVIFSIHSFIILVYNSDNDDNDDDKNL